MLSLDEIENLVKNKFVGHMERYVHTLGVVKMATYLAEQHTIDPVKAKMAAYMHYFCKYDSLEYIETLLTPSEIEECRKYPVLYHSYGSASYYKKFIGEDEDIYQAIRNHVFGRIGMSRLEEIILISDYTEENRQYPDCIYCRKLVLENQFFEAIYQSTKKTIEFLNKSGCKPHPLQEEVLIHYERMCKHAINRDNL